MKKLIVVGIIILLVGMNIPSTGIDVEKFTVSYDGNILYVGGDGPGNYTRIQDAIDNSSDGDTVFVYEDLSPYYENIIINKSIILVGEDKNTTIIDGRSAGDIVFINSDEVTVSGFTLQNSGLIWPDSGIRIHYSNETIIMENILSNNHIGIQLLFSNNNMVIGNNATDNNRSIYLISSNNNIIQNNTAMDSEHGIWIDFSSSNSVTGNNAHSNNKNGIILTTSSNNNFITDNKVSKNYWGIYLSYSYYNTITGNNVSKNYNGISLYSYSNGNKLYHNNFMNNILTVDDDCNNIWNNSYPSCGNYWDIYIGDDIFWGPNQHMNGSDGIGDNPYDISGSESKDLYPLMEAYGMTTLSLDFRGGLFKCSGGIKNMGNKTAFNVQWHFIIDGGIIFFGKESSGIIPKPLLPGEESYISSHLILGFGSIILTIAIWANNAPYVSFSTPGRLLLFYIKILI